MHMDAIERNVTQWELQVYCIQWNLSIKDTFRLYFYSPYYRGVLNSEVMYYAYTGTPNGISITEVSSIQRSCTIRTLGHRMVSLLQRCPQFRGHVLCVHWDTEWYLYYRDFLDSEVCNRWVPCTAEMHYK